MIRLFKLLAILASLLFISGCEYEGTAFLIDGRDQSITLVREQRFFWDDEVDQAIVVSRMPSCLRRYSIKSGVAGSVKMEVYEAGSMLWALKQGKNWYLASTEKCEFQVWKDAPAEPPGKLVGTFSRKGERLHFIPADKPAQPTGKPAAE